MRSAFVFLLCLAIGAWSAQGHYVTPGQCEFGPCHLGIVLLWDGPHCDPGDTRFDVNRFNCPLLQVQAKCCSPGAATVVEKGYCSSRRSTSFGGETYCCNQVYISPSVTDFHRGWCNEVGCVIFGSCHVKHTLSVEEKCYPNQCEIGSQCRNAGTFNPANSCQQCIPSKSRRAWSSAENVCRVTGPAGDTCYENGHGTQCGVCDITRRTDALSPRLDRCHPPGDTNTLSQCWETGGLRHPDDCTVCKYDSGSSDFNPAVWVPRTDRCHYTSSDGQARCLSSGQDHPEIPCFFCDGSVFHAKDDGWCFIGNKCYQAGEKNPSQTCEICKPTSSDSTWSRASDCCAIVDGSSTAYYQDGAVNPNDSCYICDVDTRWNVLVENPQHCFVPSENQGVPSKICVKNGSIDPTKPCRTCDTTSSATGWSWTPKTCHIGSIEDHPPGQPHFPAEGGYECVPQFTQNPQQPCFECLPRMNPSAWSIDDSNACSSGASCSRKAHCHFGECVDSFDAFVAAQPTSTQGHEPVVGLDFIVSGAGGARVQALGALGHAFSGSVSLYERHSDGSVALKVNLDLNSPCDQGDIFCRGEVKYRSLFPPFFMPPSFKGTIVASGYSSALGYFKSSPQYSQNLLTSCANLESRNWNVSIEDEVIWEATRSGVVAGSFPNVIGHNLHRSSCPHVPTGQTVSPILSKFTTDGAAIIGPWTVSTNRGYLPTVSDVFSWRSMTWRASVPTTRYVLENLIVAGYRDEVQQRLEYGSVDIVGASMIGVMYSVEGNVRHITAVRGITATSPGPVEVSVIPVTSTGVHLSGITRSMTGGTLSFSYDHITGDSVSTIAVVLKGSSGSVSVSEFNFDVVLSDGTALNYNEEFYPFQPAPGWSYITTARGDDIPFTGVPIAQYAPLSWDPLSNKFRAGDTGSEVWSTSQGFSVSTPAAASVSSVRPRVIFSYTLQTDTDQAGLYDIIMTEQSTPSIRGRTTVYKNDVHLVDQEGVLPLSVPQLRGIFLQPGDVILVGIASDTSARLTITGWTVSIERRFVDIQGPSFVIGEAPYCEIDGVCMEPGTVNPTNPCEVCEPQVSFGEWAFNDAGACTTCPSKLCECDPIDRTCIDVRLGSPGKPVVSKPKTGPTTSVPASPPTVKQPASVESPEELEIEPACDPLTADNITASWFGTEANPLRNDRVQFLVYGSYLFFNAVSPPGTLIGVGFAEEDTVNATMCLQATATNQGYNVGEYIAAMTNSDTVLRLPVPEVPGFPSIQNLRVTQAAVTFGLFGEKYTNITSTPVTNSSAPINGTISVPGNGTMSNGTTTTKDNGGDGSEDSNEDDQRQIAPSFSDINLKFSYPDSVLVPNLLSVSDISAGISIGDEVTAFLSGTLEIDTPFINLGNFETELLVEFGDMESVPAFSLSFERTSGDNVPLIPGVLEVTIDRGSIAFPDGPVSVAGTAKVDTIFGPLGTYTTNLELAWANGLGKGVPDALVEVVATVPATIQLVPVVQKLLEFTPINATIDTANKYAQFRGAIGVDLQIIDLGTYDVLVTMQWPGAVPELPSSVGNSTNSNVTNGNITSTSDNAGSSDVTVPRTDQNNNTNSSEGIGSNVKFTDIPDITIDIEASEDNEPIPLIPKLLRITPKAGQIRTHDRYFYFETEIDLGYDFFWNFGTYQGTAEFEFPNGYTKRPEFLLVLNGEPEEGAAADSGAKLVEVIPNVLSFKGRYASVDSVANSVTLRAEVDLIGFDGTIAAGLEIVWPGSSNASVDPLFQGSPNVTFEILTQPSISLDGVFKDYGIDATPFKANPVIKQVFETEIKLHKLVIERTPEFINLVLSIGTGKNRFYLIPGYVAVSELGFDLDTTYLTPAQGSSSPSGSAGSTGSTSLNTKDTVAKSRFGPTEVALSARWFVAGSSAVVAIKRTKGAELEASVFWEVLSLKNITEHFVGTLPTPLDLVLDLFTVNNAKMSVRLNDPTGSGPTEKTKGGNITPKSKNNDIMLFRISGEPKLTGEGSYVEIVAGKWKKKTLAMVNLNIKPANVMQTIGEILGLDLSTFNFQLATGSFLSIIASNREIDTFLNPRLNWELAPAQATIVKGLEFRFGMQLPPDCTDVLCKTLGDVIGSEFKFLVSIGVSVDPYEFRLFAGIDNLKIGPITVVEAGLRVVVPSNPIKTSVAITGSTVIRVGVQHQLKMSLNAEFSGKLQMDFDATFLGFLPYFVGFPFITAGNFYVSGRVSKDPIVGVGGTVILGMNCLNEYGRFQPESGCLLAGAGFGLGLNDLWVVGEMEGLNMKNVLKMLAGANAPPLPDFLQKTGFHGPASFAISSIEKTLPTGQELIKGIELAGSFRLFSFLPSVTLNIKIPIPAEVIKLVIDLVVLATTGASAARLGPRMLGVANEFLNGYEMTLEAAMSKFELAQGVIQLCRDATCGEDLGPTFRGDFVLAPSEAKFDYTLYIACFAKISDLVQGESLILFKPFGTRILLKREILGIKAEIAVDANGDPTDIQNAGFMMRANFDMADFNARILDPVNERFKAELLAPFKHFGAAGIANDFGSFYDKLKIRLDHASFRIGLSVNAKKGNGVALALKGTFFGAPVNLQVGVSFGDPAGLITDFFENTVRPFIESIVYVRPTRFAGCPAGMDQELLTCYDRCPSSHPKGVAFTCATPCPAGFADLGLLCLKVKTYFVGLKPCAPGDKWVFGTCVHTTSFKKEIITRRGQVADYCPGTDVKVGPLCYGQCKATHIPVLGLCLAKL